MATPLRFGTNILQALKDALRQPILEKEQSIWR
jgi:hypothetical protein